MPPLRRRQWTCLPTVVPTATSQFGLELGGAQHCLGTWRHSPSTRRACPGHAARDAGCRLGAAACPHVPWRGPHFLGRRPAGDLHAGAVDAPRCSYHPPKGRCAPGHRSPTAHASLAPCPPGRLRFPPHLRAHSRPSTGRCGQTRLEPRHYPAAHVRLRDPSCSRQVGEGPARQR